MGSENWREHTFEADKNILLKNKEGLSLEIKKGDTLRLFPYNKRFLNSNGFPEYQSENVSQIGILIADEGDIYPVRYTALFDVPESEELQEMIFDGNITSVVGDTCYELDGHDEKGFPSWPMALGLV